MMHYSELDRGFHIVKELQDDYNSYGRAYFFERILEELNLDSMYDEIRKCEAKWQKLYRSTEVGYNKVDENKNCYIVDDEYFGNIVCINKNTKEVITCKAMEVKGVIGIPISWCNKMIRYWSTVVRADYVPREGYRPLKYWKGWLFIKEAEYNKEFDYANFKEPRKKVTELKINVPYADRNLYRVPIQIINIATGKIEKFSSANDLAREKGFNKSKIYLCTVGKKKSYKGYTISKVSEQVV